MGKKRKTSRGSFWDVVDELIFGKKRTIKKKKKKR